MKNFEAYKKAQIQKLLADALKKVDIYDKKHQVEGSTSSYNTARRYEDIADACQMALAYMDDECERCKMVLRRAYIAKKKLREAIHSGKNAMTAEEALDMICSIL